MKKKKENETLVYHLYRLKEHSFNPGNCFRLNNRERSLTLAGQK